MTNKQFGIYIHIPFCKSKCGYCAFVSTPDFSLQKRYVQTLVKEITESPDRGALCDTVYIGGGTPSCLYEGAISEIMGAVNKSFAVSENAEITVECNPESVTDSFISECKCSGINRVSMGLQSSDNAVLRRIGRVHDFEKYLCAIEALSKNFDNISSDLILGLPEQTTSDIERSIKTMSEYCLHISVYALSVEEGTPLYKSGYTVDDDCIADMYDFACDLLFVNGYSRYEVSNFAKDGMQSKHNLKYWRNMPYLGFGVAAHGYDGVCTRYAHGNDISKYIEDPTSEYIELSENDRYNEYIMLALRTERGIDLSDFQNTFGYSILTRFESEINELLSCGLIVISDGFLRIAPRYMFVMNDIIEDLMIS